MLPPPSTDAPAVHLILQLCCRNQWRLQATSNGDGDGKVWCKATMHRRNLARATFVSFSATLAGNHCLLCHLGRKLVASLAVVSVASGEGGGEATANKIYDSFNFHLQRQLLNISVVYNDTSYASRFHRVDVAGAELYGVLHLPGLKLDVL